MFEALVIEAPYDGLYRMLMIRSSDSGETSSGLPQAGHFDCTPLARVRSVARAASTTTVRMRCVPHFAQVQPDDSARAIGGDVTGSRLSVGDG